MKKVTAGLVLSVILAAGGLKPLRQVGALETVGLALTGANGSSFTFRETFANTVGTFDEFVLNV